MSVGQQASLKQEIGLALQQLEAGRTAEAERLAARLLPMEPEDAESLHSLGLLALRLDKVQRGVELLERGARFGTTVDLLVNLCAGYRRLGRVNEAERCARGALALDARHADAHNNLANVLRDTGRLAEAEEHYRLATQLRPQFTAAVQNLGNLLNERGKFADAEQVLLHALALSPNDAGTFNLLGIARQKLERHDDAEASYRRALEINPQFAVALSNLGSVLAERGRFVEAEQSIRRALALKPDYPEAYNTLGNLLREMRRLKEAEACHRRALELRPRYANAINNLGNDLYELARPTEALQCYRDAATAEPSSADYQANVGNILMAMGRLEEALVSYRRTLELNPDFAAAHSNMIFAIDLMEGSDIASQQRERRAWHERHAARFAAQAQPHPNRPDPGRRLRVGYVSADFRRHSAYYAIAPIIVGHDRAGFEVYCYSGVKREDDATARLKAAATAWRSTLGMAHEALARQIRGDGIDILVDLSGHSGGNRLLAFARRPAPVQITAWGHATGTGMQAMDYFFADAVAVPADARGLFAEEVIDLPCALCYEPPDYLPPLGPLPALNGEPLTYGCVNRLEKISQRSIALWGKILAASPGARLLVKDRSFADPQARQGFLDRLGVVGINADRVNLVGPSAHAEHLEIFNRIDVGLDPFPQGGGISTAEALWMGVPIVTLIGKTPPSRFTPSILGQLGMTEWVANTDEQYVRIALEAGRDLPRLAALRASLRERLRRSSFGDLESYVRAVERSYRQLWHRWCAKR